MIGSIKTAAVYVSDQQAAIDFYTNKLGFEIKKEHQMGSGARWIEVAPPGAQTHVVLYPRNMMDGWESMKPSIMFGTTNVEASHGELEAKGVKFTQAPTKMNWGTFAKFMDPDGNEFVITDAP